MNPIAAVRAPAIATTMKSMRTAAGPPGDAREAAASANGARRTVWLKFTTVERDDRVGRTRESDAGRRPSSYGGARIGPERVPDRCRRRAGTPARARQGRTPADRQDQIAARPSPRPRLGRRRQPGPPRETPKRAAASRSPPQRQAGDTEGGCRSRSQGHAVADHAGTSGSRPECMWSGGQHGGRAGLASAAAIVRSQHGPCDRTADAVSAMRPGDRGTRRRRTGERSRAPPPAPAPRASAAAVSMRGLVEVSAVMSGGGRRRRPREMRPGEVRSYERARVARRRRRARWRSAPAPGRRGGGATRPRCGLAGADQLVEKRTPSSARARPANR